MIAAGGNDAIRMMHIVSSLDQGGAEAALHRLCTSSSERRNDVVVSLTSEGVYARALREAGLTVHALGMERGSANFSAIAKLWHMVRAARPDVVQTWMYHGDLIGGVCARLAGRRAIVWSVHNSTLDRRSTPRTTRLIMKACAFLSNFVPRRIISCSVEAARLHTRLGYAAEKMVVVPYGYDFNKFRPNSAAGARLRIHLGIAADAPLIGMVARFDPQKDVSNLLDALALLAKRGQRPHCLLVGTRMDNGNGELVRWIGDRGLTAQIHLAGPTDDVPSVMNALDIHVLSSAYGEAFPNVVAEAMACGVPCVLTDLGDARLLVADTGWVVPPRDPSGLAVAIAEALAALQDGAGWSARREACRRRIVENFALEKMVAGYEAAWRQAFGAGRLTETS